jgi:hypothetical protein
VSAGIVSEMLVQCQYSVSAVLGLCCSALSAETKHDVNDLVLVGVLEVDQLALRVGQEC